MESESHDIQFLSCDLRTFMMNFRQTSAELAMTRAELGRRLMSEGRTCSAQWAMSEPNTTDIQLQGERQRWVAKGLS